MVPYLFHLKLGTLLKEQVVKTGLFREGKISLPKGCLRPISMNPVPNQKCF